MIRTLRFAILALPLSLHAKEPSGLPPELSAYVLDAAPATESPVLKKGDRLAICGDSITEQKLYSVLVETYLTACLPELKITCRQYGWSGEQAGGFVGRMKNDVLRFKPNVATTCYGMNDFRYVGYDERIAAEYRKNEIAMVDAFQGIGCRVVLGSTGIIDSVPHWVKSTTITQPELNLSLSKFRNIGIEIAKSKGTAFADIYRPMLLADHKAKKLHGADFKVSGKDGVHPAWAGQAVMAYGFLKGLGLDGDMGTITYDEASGKTTATTGHEVAGQNSGTIELRSNKLPFAPGPGVLDKDDSLRAGLSLIPFDDELNRFTLRLTSPKSNSYSVTWGSQTKEYTADQLKTGINLAKDFQENPFVPAFAKIQEAVLKKQTYETRQIKELVHGPEGEADMEATFALTEKAREKYVRALADSRQPVAHQIQISAVQ